MEIELDDTTVIESQVELGPALMEDNCNRLLLEVIVKLRQGVSTLRLVHESVE